MNMNIYYSMREMNDNIHSVQSMKSDLVALN